MINKNKKTSYFMVLKSLIASILIALFPLVPSLLMATPTPQAGTVFDPKAKPSVGDWKRFHLLTDSQRKELWQSFESKNLTLHDWSWEWRLGWVRSCGQVAQMSATNSWCKGIIKSGLEDKAVVVRAESVKALSIAKKGMLDHADLASLENCFKRSDNSRHQKPLYVNKLIITTLLQSQSPVAKNLGRKLSDSHSSLKEHYLKLAAVNKSQPSVKNTGLNTKQKMGL